MPDTKLSDDTVRFAYYDGGTPQLDPNYTYVTYGDNDEIIVRIYHEGEDDEEVLWFFNGFTKTSDDWAVPSELQPYVPDNITSASETFASDSSTVQTGWIGWHSGLASMNLIRSWSENWTQLIAGTFYAVVDITKGQYQYNDYFDPYVYLPAEATRHIYLNGRQYSGDGSQLEQTTLQEYNALTPAQQRNGKARFIPKSNISQHLDIDMSGIQSYVERDYVMQVTASTDDFTTITYNGDVYIGCTYYYTTKIDVTKWDVLTMDIHTGSCYGGGSAATQDRFRLYVGLLRQAPSGIIDATQITWDACAICSLSNHDYSETSIDVSGLSGEYYIVVSPTGWNATIEKIQLGIPGGNPSQIKYMGETYGLPEKTSEIIELQAGDDTTSRTFTFSKTPKKVTLYWETDTTGTPWIFYKSFVWGDRIVFHQATNTDIYQDGYVGNGTLTYNGNSVTMTNANASQACNNSTGFGHMLVEY